MMNYVEHFPALATMVLFLGAFLVTIFGGKSKALRIFLAMGAATVSFVMVLCTAKYVILDGNIITYWLGNWSPVKDYAIGIGLEVDGLNAFFALLVTLTTYLSGWYSIKYMSRDEGNDYYYTLYLMLSGSVLGLVLTGDIFNMFVMIEIMTFACVALTAFRNWSKGALEAGFKYLVIGSLGSTCTLSGIALLYAQCHTLNMAQLSATVASIGLQGNPTMILAFALLITGFGIKSYAVPFHFVAADAYMAAPASVSMLFSGMVNKAGVYGLIRVCYVILQVMGLGKVQTLLVAVGTVSMFVGVTMALNQHDFKRLLAFHSISQIGYVLTAIGLGTALGVAGGLYHAMNHTLFKGLLFLCAGAVYYGTGRTNLNNMGGLAKKMPQTCIIFLIAAFSISGIPPFNGFMSKWMIYQAAFSKSADNIGYLFVTVVALITSTLTLASFIKVTQSAFFGQSRPEFEDVKEVPGSMLIPMWLMAGLCVFTGVCPNFVTEKLITPAVNAVMGVNRYIDAMMGQGYAARIMGAEAAEISAEQITIGSWTPAMWLILFGTVLVAFTVVAVFGKSSRGYTNNSKENIDNKHATFFGGEMATRSTVVGSDLFWGFRHNFKGYFEKLEGIHSGVVNDYAVWAIGALAVFVMYLNAVL